MTMTRWDRFRDKLGIYMEGVAAWRLRPVLRFSRVFILFGGHDWFVCVIKRYPTKQYAPEENNGEPPLRQSKSGLPQASRDYQGAAGET